MITFSDKREQIATLAAVELAHSLIQCSTARDKMAAFGAWDYANKDITLLDLENCFEAIKTGARTEPPR